MADVTIWLDEDEYWPWRYIEPKESLQRYSTRVQVDEATAQRWREGLAAAEALQAEIAAVWDEFTKRPNP